ncbi:hypothetical protein BJY52DRAFT_1228596 [Lactarius psammicola]|nr:hypothetical protein BJY52DRAFT_1228596 [Lactarius psammicola]
MPAPHSLLSLFGSVPSPILVPTPSFLVSARFKLAHDEAVVTSLSLMYPRGYINLNALDKCPRSTGTPFQREGVLELTNCSCTLNSCALLHRAAESASPPALQRVVMVVA